MLLLPTDRGVADAPKAMVNDRLMSKPGGAADPLANVAAKYSRQSKSKKKSIGDQDVEMDEDAEMLGLYVPDELKFSDGSGAGRGAKTRDDWELIWAAVAARRFRTLILWEQSRGDRNASTWIAFLHHCQDHGVKVRVTSVERTYDLANPSDMESLSTDGVKSEAELAKLRIRVRRGLRRNVADGKPHGKAPFGFTRIYHDRTRELIKQVPDEAIRRAWARVCTGEPEFYSPAGIIRWLFEQVLGGAALMRLAENLNNRGIPCPRLLAAVETGTDEQIAYWSTSLWSGQNIRRILLNPANIGQRLHHGEPVGEELWEGIVKENTYFDVKNMLEAPERQTVRPSRAKHLLSCLAVCFVCGDDMVYLREDLDRPVRSRRTFPIYRCCRHHCAVPAKELDDFVTRYVLKWLARSETWAALRSMENATSKAIAEARADVARFTSELNDFRSQLEAEVEATGVMPSPSLIGSLERKIQAKIDEATARANRIGIPEELKDYADKDLEEVTKVWYGLTEDTAVLKRRAVIRFAVNVKCKPSDRSKRRAPIHQRAEIDDRV